MAQSPTKREIKPTSAPVRRKRRSPEELRDRIIEAAVGEFEACGYSGATTAAIARKAETTEAQIFRLFDSKAELFRAAIFVPLNAHFADFQARNWSGPQDLSRRRELSERYIGELQDFIGEHSRMLMSLIVARAYGQGEAGSLGAIDGLEAYFAGGAATMRASSGDKPRVPHELMVRVSFAAVLGSVMFRDWLFPEGLASEDAIRRAIADFTLDGISANHSLEPADRD